MSSFNLKFFSNIVVNGERNINKFKIDKRKVIIANMGIKDYGFVERNYNKIELLYIGTLNNREVWKSVIGFYLFTNNNPNLDISYHIVGGGKQEEIDKIKAQIAKYDLNEKVKLYGFLPTEKVKKLFEYCNVGVAYVPVNSYFQNSSYKTLEYLISGLPVIATANSFRSKVINKDNGVLCNDNPESFTHALQSLVNNIHNYDNLKIRNSFKHLTQKNKIKNEYVPCLRKVLLKAQE